MSVDADMMGANLKSCEQHVRGTTCPVNTTNKARPVTSWLAVPRFFFCFFGKLLYITYSGLVIHLRTAEAGPDLACTLVALVVVLLLREGNWAGGKRARDPMSLGA